LHYYIGNIYSANRKNQRYKVKLVWTQIEEQCIWGNGAGYRQ